MSPARPPKADPSHAGEARRGRFAAPDPLLQRTVVHAAAAVVGVLAVAALAAWAVYTAWTIIAMLVVAVFVAIILEPPVEWLTRRRWPRPLATASAMAALLLLATVLVFGVGRILVAQLGALLKALPGYVHDLKDGASSRFDVDLSGDRLLDSVTDPGGPISGAASGLAGSVVNLGSGFALFAAQAATVLFFSFYLAMDGPRIRGRIASWAPEGRRAQIERSWSLAVHSMALYIGSRGVLAAISALCHTVFFLLIGEPYALVLGVWVGLVSQFVPTVGTFIAGLLPLLVALAVDPLNAVWILLFLLVYQQIENQGLTLWINRRTLSIHPLTSFVAVLVGAALAGGFGALFAIPVVAMARALAAEWPVQDRRRPDEPQAKG
ncbi:putative PurR-regulated permease PerM [Murinocardiopsis flavida]|uniref:Putative PurR-regulated permease PerM n=1 Tax=Murinocardiopsis flavida TaxID=645275 RepID=A0A2P8CPQ1_9ACTN|nr:AI-2E family transporter [Murinocardiopsis flavida]PSK86934.1 putative PurR-regulated permease PerM [Murinocardiopsis flavida]